MKQNNWYRHSVQQLREARELVEREKQAERKRRQENVKAGHGKKHWSKIVERKLEIFDGLTVGDSLEPLGVPSVIAKKNAKSVITTLGMKYTRKELTGAV